VAYDHLTRSKSAPHKQGISSMPPLPQHNEKAMKRQKTQRRRKILKNIGLILFLFCAVYILFRRPIFLDPVDLPKVRLDENGVPHSYGENAQPPFAEMIHVQDLPSNLLPETGKHRSAGRLVIVGDVHGMKTALEALLKKIGFVKEEDHLILAGDMISKGPDSAGVVDLAMKLGASGVRGNHEDRIILAHKDMVSQHAVEEGPNQGREKVVDDMEEESGSHGDYKDRALVRALGEKRIKWLKECPVILRVGKLGNLGEVVVVHAGLAPGVKLERQDPALVMNMRTISEDGVPSDQREGKGWMKVWNKYQKNLPKSERTTVIYGHDSKRGLQVEKYSMGIDTGCLKGGRLTAVVIEGGKFDHSSKLVHVDCVDGRQGR
jgi:hypothetical protein